MPKNISSLDSNAIHSALTTSHAHLHNPSTLHDISHYTIEVGKLGRAIGLKGALALHLTSDFASFLQQGTTLLATPSQQILTIKSIAPHKAHYLVSFMQINSRDMAQHLLHECLLTSEQETRAKCHLKPNEFFYFDIIGLPIIEEGIVLGHVSQIERIGSIDYFHITRNNQNIMQANASPSYNTPREIQTHITASSTHKTTKPHIKQRMQTSKNTTFLIPYINQYVSHITLTTPTQQGGIYTHNARFFAE